jgi:hypothetical protein
MKRVDREWETSSNLRSSIISSRGSSAPIEHAARPSPARLLMLALALGTAWSAVGCALQPYALISTAVHPGDYPRPLQNADIPPTATLLSRSAAGEACSHNLLGVYAWGDASIATAARNALANANSRAGDATMLADVKLDHRVFSILGVYSDFCTQVSGVALK